MNNTTPQTPPPAELTPAEREALQQQRRIVTTIIVAGIILLVLVGLAVFWLLQDATQTETIRDILIVFLALESLVIGVALIVLIVQVATLVNLVQNEIRPILEATNETVKALRGTTAFLSENLVEPVVKLNSYLAGLQRMLDMIGLKRK
jgi:hypothetical protein